MLIKAAVMSNHEIRTSRQIRQDFLDFFQAQGHTLVPSSSLMPDSPNLLFTNAGMNQFVPIFLGQQKCPYTPPRAADTQKCIRAGGKHNDLEDVGLDTYHHTFFEMLGNWSFGNYFKTEAIDWAWELVTEVWRLPKERLYATVYCPDKSQGDPSEFDQEAYDCWAAKFIAAGLDPKVHIRNGNKKDNFWMMGETGPCGPCSEIHMDLTPKGDTRGELVNQGSPQCIEIWNLVFMQFNANPHGTYSPLPAKSVDTGMGFERVASIIQCTKNFTDFTGIISNYETDIFRPIFNKLEEQSGKRYGSTLPKPGSSGVTEQEKIDVAFRVIADHIRTLSFAIADGIVPANTDRNYVLRRILRRAVRYGRTLGFRQPFFFELVDVLAETMGDVFPEVRARKEFVQDTIQAEEEAFNRTLDRGIEWFNEEAERLLGSARVPRAGSGVAPEPSSSNVRYSKRRLPHFERPWAKYMISFSTVNRRQLAPASRDIVLKSMLHLHEQRRYEMYAACVMPDHAHFLIEPQIKEDDQEGKPVFWPLTEILHSLKSFTAHEINKSEGTTGPVWEKESFDRLIRSGSDLEEKFHYICGNPWSANVVGPNESYPWIWTPAPRRDAEESTRDARAPQSLISGDFAFKLYDTYGFPLDLTQLMARERGLNVDTDGFDRLMDEQKKRSQAAQKRQVIELSQIDATTPTSFVGYDKLETTAKVLEVVSIKDKTAVILDTSSCYAEMGGQVGDTGQLSLGGSSWRIVNTQKVDNTWLHFLETGNSKLDTLPAPGSTVALAVDVSRRAAIQRHHTVTHLLHWALHEVVSKDVAQKGSYVGPDKLTFDFNSVPLTPEQVLDIERLVNERIVENTPVAALELAYGEIKNRPEVMQFFGEKYGDTVRVIQIGGQPGQLDGYSMELCGGTHARATGEIGLFRIVSEGAIAAGVRRIEAVAGLCAYQKTRQETALIGTLASKVNSPVGELEHKLDNLLVQQKELEKRLKAMQQKQAAETARSLVAQAQTVGSVRAIIQNLGEVDGEYLQNVTDVLKGEFKGVVVLAGVGGGTVGLAACVAPELTKQFQAGKIIQTIAPIVGGKGGGKPDFARGGGKDASKVEEALAKAQSLLG